MLTEADANSNTKVIRSNVAIVGAGPAGIVLALELAKSGIDVVLIESGNPKFSERIQALSDAGEIDLARHAPMADCTRRQLGGASVIWGGRCVPFDPVDFDDRPYVPHSRWPIEYCEIAGYFQRASEYFFCGRAEFDVEDAAGVERRPIVPGLPNGDVISTSLERWSLPTDFGREYGSALNHSSNIRLLCGITCTEVECSADGHSVTGIRGRALDGGTIRILADQCVLACGGLETTRLLFCSDRRHPGGLGNHSGQLGRFYMGHVSGEIARARFSTDPRHTAYGFDRDQDGVYVRRRFSFARSFLHRFQLANCTCYPVNPKIHDPAHGNGVLSFAYLALSSTILGKRLASDAIRKAAIGKREAVSDWQHWRNVLFDCPRALAFAATFGFRRFVKWRKIPGFYQFSAENCYPLHYNCEHLPNPESRVQVGRDVDEMGMRKLRVDLRYGQTDYENVIEAHRHLDEYLRSHGCGALEYLTDDPVGHVKAQASHGFHQCGTTRMSSNPVDGVVDPNCRVHGLENLYVASSSVFVTSGQAGPTFMIVAFALRLADHLKRVQMNGRRIIKKSTVASSQSSSSALA